MEAKNKRVVLLVCLAYTIWQVASQWTNTLLSFLYWSTQPPMNVIQISYVQAMGSFCNAIGAFALGQVSGDYLSSYMQIHGKYKYCTVHLSFLMVQSFLTIIDITGSKSVFLASIIMTSLYYATMSYSQSFVVFMLAQMFRIGYHFEAGAEMYLATVTTERERTTAMLNMVSIPQAISFIFGPLIASRCAAWAGLRGAELICGVFLAASLIPLVGWILPDTHDVPKLASARLQPFDGGIPLLTKNGALREAISLRVLLVAPYICYELVGRQFIMRKYFHCPFDMAMLMLVTGLSMFVMQFGLLRHFQRSLTPRRTLQCSMALLSACYLGIIYAKSYPQMLVISALQSAAYALAYAEISTQLTSSVELTQLGKATGLASTCLWAAYCVMPLITGQLAMVAHYTYAIYLSVAISALTYCYVTFVCDHVDNRLKNVLPTIGVGRF